jgi:hypothetical protein
MARSDMARTSPAWSGLLLFTLAVAVAATIGLALAIVFAGLRPPGPPPPVAVNGPRPAPLATAGLTAVIVTAALFVLSWGAVAFTYLRDLFAHRFAELTNRIVELTTEYGELRETDGYLHGFRQASGAGGVRSLHPVPPAE